VDRYTYIAVPATLSVSAPSTSNAGAAFSVTVTAKDGNGNTATGYTGTVHVSSTDGAAVLPSNYTFTTADAGVDTFTGVVLKTAGTQTITATDTVTAGITGTSGGIGVSPAVVATFAVPTIGTQVAGTQYSTSVTAKDAYGNLTDNVGTITVSGSALAASPNSTTATESLSSFVSGVATLTVTSVDATTTAGLTVANGTVIGSSNSFTVSPAVVAIFAVPAIGTQVAGTQYSTSETAKDAYGNLTDNVGTVTVSGSALAASPNSTTATESLSSFVSGVATLTVTSVDATTTAMLSVNNGTVVGFSYPFTVSPAAAAFGEIINSQATGGVYLHGGGAGSDPAVYSAGSWGTVATPVAQTFSDGRTELPGTAYTVAVQLVDVFGNVVTTGTGNVTLTLNSATASPSGSVTGAATVALATAGTPVSTTVAVTNGYGTFTYTTGSTAGETDTLAVTSGTTTGLTSFTLNVTD
jgi:hypothetical protein